MVTMRQEEQAGKRRQEEEAEGSRRRQQEAGYGCSFVDGDAMARASY